MIPDNEPMLSLLKKIYLKIGIHSAPPGTLFHTLHRAVFRAYVAVAVMTGYQKKLLLRRGELKDTPVTAWRVPQRNADRVRRILLLKLDHIGDFVLAIPAFRLMRDIFPKAEITLLCGAWNRELAERSGLFDRLVVADVFAEITGESSGLSLSSETRATLAALPEFDIAVDARVEEDTREILHLIRARYKAGYESQTAPSDMTLTLPRPPCGAWDAPEKDHSNRRLLYMLVSGVAADFLATATARETLAAIAGNANAAPLDPDRASFPTVGIHTGSGTPARKWPFEHFSALIKRLLDETGATVILFGSRQETGDAARLVSLVPSDRLVDRTGKLTLSEFTASLGVLDLFIGNDTGTTHLAAGLGVPVICLFSGVSIPGRLAPMGEDVSVLFHAVPCAPCHLQKVEDCPRDHLCLRSLTVDGVMEEAGHILDVLRQQKSNLRKAG
jgi:ADP-heptose:LPS heptosyltransferase